MRFRLVGLQALSPGRELLVASGLHFLAHLVALHPSVESKTQAEVSILDHANLTGSQMRPKILLHSGRSPL